MSRSGRQKEPRKIEMLKNKKVSLKNIFKGKYGRKG
jgi:hypothetical protein